MPVWNSVFSRFLCFIIKPLVKEAWPDNFTLLRLPMIAVWCIKRGPCASICSVETSCSPSPRDLWFEPEVTRCRFYWGLFSILAFKCPSLNTPLNTENWLLSGDNKIPTNKNRRCKNTLHDLHFFSVLLGESKEKKVKEREKKGQKSKRARKEKQINGKLLLESMRAYPHISIPMDGIPLTPHQRPRMMK